MKKIKFAISAALGVIAVIMPLVFLILAAVLLPPQYTNYFHGALDEKYERLNSIDERKIVVVGGSSVAFGLESEKLEEYTGLPVVNFGLYAALGTKLMLDLSRSGINEGDIVVLAPELDAQTMSMYFSSEETLKAVDDDYSMALRVRGADNKFSMIGSLFGHVCNKLEFMRDGTPNPAGVYNSKNFNEYGDVEYDRPSNVLESYYDANTLITLDESILEDEFIEYLNEYIEFCENRGASVYFSYCPMNELALAPGTTDESIAAFEATLRERIDCKHISDIEGYIMPAGYFYDTNFHLNDKGSLARTILLAEDIMLAEDITALIKDEIPDEPPLKSNLIMVDGTDENEVYFIYSKIAETGNYEIVGLTDLGRAQKVLTVPKSVALGDTGKGIGVTSIGEGAFSGALAERIIIPEDTHLKQIKNGAFAGAGSVTRLEIYFPDAQRILPPTDNFSGAADGFSVHAPSGSNYKADYNWSENVKEVPIVEDLEK